MELTLNNIYEYLEANKNKLPFEKRSEVDNEFGPWRFSTLYWGKEKKTMPENLKEFLIKTFNIKERECDFIQIHKYEVGDYILPHTDNYPCFNLLCLSTSNLDGVVIEQQDKTYKFYPDEVGAVRNVPAYKWHWVNPVREKTRYSAVYGLTPLNNYDLILEQ